MNEKFWLGKKNGKGTLGELNPGDPIPEGLLSPKRLKHFEDTGCIGEKVVKTNAGDDSKTAKIKELVSFLQDADLEIKNLNEKINGLEALNAKFTADEDLLRAYTESNKVLEEEKGKLVSENEQATKDLASLKVKVSKIEKTNKDLKETNKKLKADSKDSK